MDASNLRDSQLVERIKAEVAVPKALIDEYYRRCIPLYLDFLGIHWHTGFYRDGNTKVSPQDQVRMIDHIASSINLSEHDRVLDVGCGIGATLCHLNQRLGCEAVGLTPVPEQKKMAEYLAASRKVSIQVDLGHAEALPYPDNSFDAVTFFESTCHFEDRQAFFKEVFRVLKPGGRLAGEDWLAANFLNKCKRVKWIDPICKTWAIPMLGDKREYQRLMESSHLIDIKIIDMQTIMPLHKGFAVTQEDLSALEQEIKHCSNPLLALTLRGLKNLGKAVNEGAFTIGQFMARKPYNDLEIGK
jgi:ubiquinone/menaquinone biosynthesis C-methylase UbiE